MSLKDKNIEELFRSGLEDAELPVNDAMWSNISKSIGQSAVTTTAISTAKVLTYVGLSGAACAIGVAATLFFANPSTTTKESNQAQLPAVNNSNEVVNENNISAVTSNDDKEIVEQIVANEAIKDPVIASEKTKATKKVVTVTEKDKQYYKGNSWVNDYLTPRSSTFTESTTASTSPALVTEKKPENTAKEVVKPTISEVENDVILASIVAMPIGGYAPLEVSFAHYSEKGTAHWDFGDGTSSDNNSASHTFDKFGKYTVTLTIKDEKGKEYKDYKVIEVLPNSALTKIPNVFTPNNDGTNDYFLIEGKNIESFSLSILNLDGNILYQSTDISEKWDGKNKFGEDVPVGTYVVVIAAKGVDGKKYEHSGTVNLKR